MHAPLFSIRPFNNPKNPHRFTPVLYPRSAVFGPLGKSGNLDWAGGPIARPVKTPARDDWMAEFAAPTKSAGQSANFIYTSVRLLRWAGPRSTIRRDY